MADPPAAEPRQLVTARLAAHQLSCGKTSLYKRFRLGDLTPIKVGARTYVSASELASFVERQRAAAEVKQAAADEPGEAQQQAAK